MRLPRPTHLVVAMMMLALAAGCGSGEPPSPGDDASDAPLSPTDYGFDTSDVGDDLLGPTRQGTTRPGAPAEVSVLIPSSYDGSLGLSPVESMADGITYELSLEYVPGKTSTEAGEGATSSDPGTELQSDDIEIDGRPFTVIVAGSESGSSRIFLLGDGDSSYALQLEADAPLSQVPDAKVEEIHQAVASMEIEPA